MIDINKYFNDFEHGEQKRLSKAVKINHQYLSQIKNGHVLCSAKLAQKLEAAAEQMGRKLPKEALRPDLWPGKAA